MEQAIERLPKPLHASVRRALRQAWELDDADKAERLLRNLARRLDQQAPGVAARILEGLAEMLTVNRLGLPVKLRRSLACTNSIDTTSTTACIEGLSRDKRRELLVVFLARGVIRMNRIRPCWAPVGTRPAVAAQLIREYVYLYGA